MHERTHHKTRHPIQRTRRSGHAMGGDASGAGNSRALLARNGAGRRSPSCDAARGRVARRGSSLQYCLHLTEGRELRRNPHVILTTGCNQWTEGFDVVVEGDAVRITAQDALVRLASVWATKWDGSWQFQVRDGYFCLYDEDDKGPLQMRISSSPSSLPRSSRSPEATSATPVTSSDFLCFKTSRRAYDSRWEKRSRYVLGLEQLSKTENFFYTVHNRSWPPYGVSYDYVRKTRIYRLY